MSLVLTEHKRGSRRRRRARAYWAVLLGWWVALYVGASMPATTEPRVLWLVVHLGMLVVGLGAAVMVEYAGALWVMGRGTLGELRQVEQRLAPLAWLGFAGMLASGMLLAPDMSSPATAVKMIAVLIIGLNAVGTSDLAHELRRLPPSIPFGRTPLRLRRWAVASGATSQIAWWTATLVGAIATANR